MRNAKYAATLLLSSDRRRRKRGRRIMLADQRIAFANLAIGGQQAAAAIQKLGQAMVDAVEQLKQKNGPEPKP